MKIIGNEIHFETNKIVSYVSYEGQISNTHMFKQQFKIVNLTSGEIEREGIETLEHAHFIAENTKK